MSVNKILSAGFGPGGAFGTPTTTSVTGTFTPAAGQWMIAGLTAAATTGVFIQGSSTTNGVTGTWGLSQANQGGFFVSDGSSIGLVGTATIVLVPIN